AAPPPPASGGVSAPPPTAGTAWVVRRCNDLLPQLLRLAADEVRHRARGTSARLDLNASAAVSEALAALSRAEQPDAGGADAEAQRRRTATNRTGVPGTACAAAGRSAARTTAITG
ncbi:hypothetical protein ACFW7O_22475, partial [Streptomyces diastatochromogenes]